MSNEIGKLIGIIIVAAIVIFATIYALIVIFQVSAWVITAIVFLIDSIGNLFSNKLLSREITVSIGWFLFFNTLGASFSYLFSSQIFSETQPKFLALKNLAIFEVSRAVICLILLISFLFWILYTNLLIDTSFNIFMNSGRY